MLTTDRRQRRVLHVAQPVEAGVAVVVRHMVEHQVALGWDVAVACPPTGSLPEWISKAGGTVLPWTATRSPGPGAIRETIALRRAVRQWAPDLIHLHSSKAGLAGRLAIRGSRPTVYQPHAWSFLAVHGLLRLLTTFWERAACRWTDATVCVSHAEQHLGQRRRIRATWYVCPNGVDLQTFRPPTAAQRSAARRRLGLVNQLVVLCVGRLCEQKGQDILLEAWKRFPANTDSVLALVGDGPDRQRLEEMAGESVIFAGSTDDVQSWYDAASLLVQPSRWEGASLTTREAMACGLSVVATDVAGVREAVNEECGEVVPVLDHAALGAALDARLFNEELRAKEGAAGHRTAASSFDLKETLRRVDEVYDRVLRDRNLARHDFSRTGVL